jgi:hypothetical protein
MSEYSIQTNHYVGHLWRDLYIWVRISSEIINRGTTLFYGNPHCYCVHLFNLF